MRKTRSRRSAHWVGLVVLAVLAAGLTAAPAQGDEPRNIAYASFSSPDQLAAGEHDGTRATHGDLRFARSVGTRDYDDPFDDAGARSYDYARWTSPTTEPGFALSELVASWTARTPGDSWVEIEMRGTTTQGSTSKWYVLGRWAEDDTYLHRTSAGSQRDADGRVAIDTFVAADGHEMDSYQLRVTLLRASGSHVTPTVHSVGAMASNLPDTEASTEASPLGGAEGIVLDVPTYSQETHIGHYPQWDDGGEAWCSPTSTAMVLRYWRSGPRPNDYAWVDPDNDPWVDHAARHTFDYAYDGAGNWPYNTAYAGRYGMNAFVTRLRSLTEAEQFIKAGIPLVVSMSFEADELDGAGYGTNGHLMVIRGFDAEGNVVANDPASHLIPDNDEVEVTYDRLQFENAWLPHSGGIAYVIAPNGKRLPTAPDQANW